MIDLEQIRRYFSDTIIASGIFSSNAIAWENVVFDPTGKSLWAREGYLNIDEGFSDSVNGDQLQGILSYSINVPIGAYAKPAKRAVARARRLRELEVSQGRALYQTRGAARRLREPTTAQSSDPLV